jgi:hypothetical protein
MKTTLFFIFTCLVSTGAMLGALHEKNPFPNFAVALGIWLFFIWVQGRRSRKRNRQNTCAPNTTTININLYGKYVQ